MSIIDEQFEALKKEWPKASAQRLHNGTLLITVPDLPLPGGWTADHATVRFLAPVGYPHARPDCFWADEGLRRATGALPQASNVQEIPDSGGVRGLWFSWHVGQWNPNRDNLKTFLKVIRNRFSQAQ
jgi:hypothetical protein